MSHHKNPHLVHLQYRPDIDGLRAVAILAVVLFHAFPGKMSGGFIGVDIFFVISGFLISTIIFSSLERDRFSLVEFYVRRIRRIFPALVLVLATSLIVGWFILFSDEYQQLGKHTAAGAAFIQNFVLWRESGYFDNAAETKPLLHLWSLAVEEQFYIVWPVLLVFVWRRQWSFLSVTVGLGVVSFAANIYLMQGRPIAAFYFPISRFWELMIGGVLAYTALHKPQFAGKYPNSQSALGFLLIVGGLLFLNKGSEFPGWWALLPTLGAMFIISAGPNAWLNQKLLASKPMVGIGLISYPLYLWHWVLLSFSNLYSLGDRNDFVIICCIVLALALSIMTYRLIEIPAQRRMKKSSVVMLSISLMIAILIAGVLINRGTINRGTNEHEAETQKLGAVRGAAIRVHLCHMNPADSQKGFKDSIGKNSETCLKLSQNKPNMLVVGDSHAADLWVGLNEGWPEINFLQATGAGCTPTISLYESGRNAESACRDLIKNAFDYALTANLDGIILAGRWSSEIGDLTGTIGMLTRKNKKVYVVGNPLELTTDAYKIIAKQPGNITRYVSNRSLITNDSVRKIANLSEAIFIDRIQAFCGRKMECPIARKGELLIIDYGHLSKPGAIFLGQQLRARGLFAE